MIKHLALLLRDDKATAAVEYGLVVALIGAVIVLALTGLGETLESVFSYMDSTLR